MKRWSRNWSKCRACHTTRRKHVGHGYCARCYTAGLRDGSIKPKKKYVQVRMIDGVKQFKCTKCDGWKTAEWFPKGRGNNEVSTPCKPCRKQYLKDNKDRLQPARREYQRQKRLIDKAAVARERKAGKRSSKQQVDPMRRIRVSADVLRPMIDKIVSTMPEDEATYLNLGAYIRINEKTIRMIVQGKRDLVDFDQAERIAIASGGSVEDLLEEQPGVEGWGPGYRHCRRCGTDDRPHHGKGYCEGCYSVARWYETQGRPVPPPRFERWSIHGDSCKRCGTMKKRHHMRGLCTSCVKHYQNLAKKAGRPLPEILTDHGYLTFRQKAPNKLAVHLLPNSIQ